MDDFHNSRSAGVATVATLVEIVHLSSLVATRGRARVRRSSSAAVSSSSLRRVSDDGAMDGWPGHRSPRPPAGAVRIGWRRRRAEFRSSSLRRAEGGGGHRWSSRYRVVLSKARERQRGRLYSAAKNSCWAVECERALGEAVDHDGRGSSGGGRWAELLLRRVRGAAPDANGRVLRSGCSTRRIAARLRRRWSRCEQPVLVDEAPRDADVNELHDNVGTVSCLQASDVPDGVAAEDRGWSHCGSSSVLART